MPMRKRVKPAPRQWQLLIEIVGEAHEVRQAFDRICRQSSLPVATAARIAAALEEIWTGIVPGGAAVVALSPPGAPGVTLAFFVYCPAAEAGADGAEQSAFSHLPDDVAFFVVHKPPPDAEDTNQIGHWIGLYLHGE